MGTVLDELLSSVKGLVANSKNLGLIENDIVEFIASDNLTIKELKGKMFSVYFKNDIYIEYMKPVVKGLCVYKIGTKDYEYCFKMYQAAMGAWTYELEGEFHSVFSTLMNKYGLEFGEAALLDNLNSRMSPNYGFNYQIGAASVLEKKNEAFYRTLLNEFFKFPIEKIENIDSCSDDRRTFRYFTALKYGLLGQAVCAHNGFNVPNSVKFYLDMESKLTGCAGDLYSDGKRYNAVMFALTFNYLLQLHRDCGEDIEKFIAAFVAKGESVVPYKFMVRAFCQDGFSDNSVLKAADEAFFSNPKFLEEVFAKKNVSTYYMPLFIDLINRAVNVHGLKDAVFAGIAHTANRGVWDACSQIIYLAPKVYLPLAKDYINNNKLNTKSAEVLDGICEKLKALLDSSISDMPEDAVILELITEYEKRFIGLKKTEHDHIRWYNAVGFSDKLNKQFVSVLKREGKEGFKKFIIERIGKTISFNAVLTFYFRRVESTTESKLIIETIFENEPLLMDMFSSRTLEACNLEDIMSVLEDGIKTYKNKKIIIRALLESSSKKVTNFCLDKIAEDYENLSPILDEEIKGYAKLNKDAEVAIKALKQRFDTSKSNKAFSSIGEVEEFARGEAIDFKNIFAKANFAAMTPVLDKTRTKQVSTKVLEVIYDKYFAMKDVYRLSLCDSMVRQMDRATFVKFTEEVFEYWKSNNYDSKQKAFAAPYVFYASNARLLALKKQCVELCDCNRHTVSAYLIETMAMNGGKYALMLVENMGNKFPYPKSRQVAKDAMVKVAEKYKISVDKLGDLIIPTYDFNKDGVRRFKYGANDYLLLLKPDGSIEITKDGKVVKAFPSDSSSEAAAHKKEFSDLKKDVKTFFKLQASRFERDLLTGYARTFKDFKRCLCASALVRGMVSNLVWGRYAESGELLTAFRYNLDGAFTDVDYNDIEFNSTDIIALVHPTDFSKEEFSKWIAYLADNEMKQPITQIHQQPLFINEKLVTTEKKSIFLDLSKFDCNLGTAMKIANRFNMIRLPVCDGAGFAGYYLENHANDLGVDVCLDGLYVSCDYEEGENLALGFFHPSEAKIDYWQHDESKYINPLTVPTRFMSTLLSVVVGVVPGELGLENEGKVVKTKFAVEIDGNDFDLDDEAEASSELTAEEMAAIVAAAEKPKLAEPVKQDKTEKPAQEKKTNAVRVEVGSVSHGDKVRLEFVEGVSNKFWEITVSENTHTVTYGKIGTVGVSQAKTFADNNAAKNDAEKLVRSKTAKGYKKV